MSASEREAFIACGIWMLNNELSAREHGSILAQASLRYPDSPCKSVREIVVEWLKANGYDGLYSPEYGCCCIEVLIERDGRKCICTASTFSTCRPGVLKDGKIVERE
jgi:hypothetical protein